MLTSVACTKPRRLPGVRWMTLVTRCGLPLCMMTLPSFSWVAAIIGELLEGGGRLRGCGPLRGPPQDDCGRGLCPKSGAGGKSGTSVGRAWFHTQEDRPWLPELGSVPADLPRWGQPARFAVLFSRLL